MSTVTWLFVLAFLGAACVNWWSRWRGVRRAELWSKPLALVALIGVAVSLDPADSDVRAWFVAALVASLLGDLFLLFDDRWFLAGLGSFLLAHVLYTCGFLVAPDWTWFGSALAAIVMLAMILTVGRRIVGAAGEQAPALRAPVAAYLLVISTMAVTAAGAGNGWAIVGAALFVISDAILGWHRFVGGGRWMGPAVMVTYHLGQAGLVVSLL